MLYGAIEIGSNTNIGWNAVVLPGVKIGNNCIIGANAVVSGDIPNNSVAAGVPARVICSVRDYYAKHRDDLVPTFSLSCKQKKKYLEEHRADLLSIDGIGGGNFATLEGVR